MEMCRSRDAARSAERSGAREPEEPSAPDAEEAAPCRAAAAGGRPRAGDAKCSHGQRRAGEPPSGRQSLLASQTQIEAVDVERRTRTPPARRKGARHARHVVAVPAQLARPATAPPTPGPLPPGGRQDRRRDAAEGVAVARARRSCASPPRPPPPPRRRPSRPSPRSASAASASPPGRRTNPVGAARPTRLPRRSRRRSAPSPPESCRRPRGAHPHPQVVRPRWVARASA